MAGHDTRRVVHWRTILDDWRTSGLPVAAFCRSQHINKSGFHRWRTILEQLDRTPTTHLPTPDEHKPSLAFVPLRVIPEITVELLLPSGIQLRVPLSADVQQLAHLVLALGGTSC